MPFVSTIEQRGQSARATAENLASWLEKACKEQNLSAGGTTSSSTTSTMVVLRARVAAGRLGGASRRGGIGVALSTTATKSWVPDDARSLEKAAMTSVLHDFTQSQLRKAEKMVPWFLSQMPAAYFRLVSDEERLSHLQATTQRS